MLRAAPAASPCGTIKTPDSGSRTSSTYGISYETTGNPYPIASAITMGNPSKRDVIKSRAPLRYSPPTSSV